MSISSFAADMCTDAISMHAEPRNLSQQAQNIDQPDSSRKQRLSQTQMSEISTGSRTFSTAVAASDRMISTSNSRLAHADSAPIKTPFKYAQHDTQRRKYVNDVGVGNATLSWVHGFRGDIQRVIDAGSVRSLTMHELVESVDDLFRCKRILSRDHRCSYTMETCVYSYLDKKYGLRNLAVQAAATLLCAADCYEQMDWRVAVFVRAFRNDIDDEFYFAQHDFVAQLRENLYHSMQESLPLKQCVEIKALYAEFVKNGTVTEALWNELLKRVCFSPQEVETVSDLLLACASSANKQERSPILPQFSVSTDSVTFASKAVTRSPVRGSGTSSPLQSALKYRNNIEAPGLAGGKPKCRRGYLAYCGKGADESAVHESKYGNRLGMDTGAGESSYETTDIRMEAIDDAWSPVAPLLGVSYAQFEHVLAHYQLSIHLQALSPLKAAFAANDVDGDGFLNNEAYFVCCRDVLCSLRKDEGSGDSSVSHSFVSDNIGMGTYEPLTSHTTIDMILRHHFSEVVRIVNPEEFPYIAFSSAVAGFKYILQQLA
jgi:hypothetical protein